MDNSEKIDERSRDQGLGKVAQSARQLDNCFTSKYSTCLKISILFTFIRGWLGLWSLLLHFPRIVLISKELHYWLYPRKRSWMKLNQQPSQRILHRTLHCWHCINLIIIFPIDKAAVAKKTAKSLAKIYRFCSYTNMCTIKSKIVFPTLVQVIMNPFQNQNLGINMECTLIFDNIKNGK